jgi:hypothetical protein
MVQLVGSGSSWVLGVVRTKQYPLHLFISRYSRVVDPCRLNDVTPESAQILECHPMNYIVVVEQSEWAA